MRQKCERCGEAMTEAGAPYFGRTSWLCQKCGTVVVLRSSGAEPRRSWPNRRGWLVLILIGLVLLIGLLWQIASR